MILFLRCHFIYYRSADKYFFKNISHTAFYIGTTSVFGGPDTDLYTVQNTVDFSSEFPKNVNWDCKEAANGYLGLFHFHVYVSVLFLFMA